MTDNNMLGHIRLFTISYSFLEKILIMFILPISPFKAYHHLLDRDSQIMIFANFPNYNELNIFL